MPKPNLFIIGAQKSGTTSLHDFLSGHAEIFMSEPKEPGFFTPEVGYYPTDEAWYLSLFEHAADASVIGESSTHYTKVPRYEGVPERIAAWADDPRFIYVMRDPVERAISHYWHDVRRLHERRSVEEAVTPESEYIVFGDYARQLEPYFAVFDRARFLLLTFEELVERPERVLPSVLAWLGVDPVPTSRLPASNVRPDALERVRGFGVLHAIRTSRAWDAVAPLVPRTVRRWAGRLAVGEARVDPVAVAKAKERIRPYAAERVDALSELLGRGFPEWRVEAAGAEPRG